MRCASAPNARRPRSRTRHRRRPEASGRGNTRGAWHPSVRMIRAVPTLPCLPRVRRPVAAARLRGAR
ncbi:Peptidoglycan-binding protein LysM (fragment) [Luteimonas sp. 9C]